jgi:hypothetical protein
VPAILHPLNRPSPDLPGTGGGAPPDRFDDHGGGGRGDDDGDAPEPAPLAGWVTLAAFWYPAQAHIARLRLEAAGVTCVLVGEIAAATHVLNIASGGVKLQVPRAQLERARRLLKRSASDGLPEARVALADFERLLHAKSAACVVEAAGLWCEVIERRDFMEIPWWGRLVPSVMRVRLWPAACLVVERDDLPAAAGALERTPFGQGLTQAARAAAPDRRCGWCDAEEQWRVWQLSWRQSALESAQRESARRENGVISNLLPRLVRKCGRCGQEWMRPAMGSGLSGQEG